jgi:hypothetical protein
MKGLPETSIRVETTVDAPVERAFRAFTEEFDRIKPREHNLLPVEIRETVFERRVGGRVYDRGVDGSAGLASSLTSRPTASSSVGILRRIGRSRLTPRKPARSKSGSSPSAPTERA